MIDDPEAPPWVARRVKRIALVVALIPVAAIVVLLVLRSWIASGDWIGAGR